MYLGQHIASSAFLPTCLSKWRRGKPAQRAALLRVSASVLNVSTVHALSHTAQHIRALKRAVPSVRLQPYLPVNTDTNTHAGHRVGSDQYKHSMRFIRRDNDLCIGLPLPSAPRKVFVLVIM